MGNVFDEMLYYIRNSEEAKKFLLCKCLVLMEESFQLKKFVRASLQQFTMERNKKFPVMAEHFKYLRMNEIFADSKVIFV